jgi:malic enzyme
LKSDAPHREYTRRDDPSKRCSRSTTPWATRKIEVVPPSRARLSAIFPRLFLPFAEPCREIARDGTLVDTYTAAQPGRRDQQRDGVLGLGNIGPRAAKPVMEGNRCFFKRLADIDVFDLGSTPRPDRFIEAVATLSSRPSAPSISRTSALRIAFTSKSS